MVGDGGGSGRCLQAEPAGGGGMSATEGAPTGERSTSRQHQPTARPPCHLDTEPRDPGRGFDDRATPFAPAQHAPPSTGRPAGSQALSVHRPPWRAAKPPPPPAVGEGAASTAPGHQRDHLFRDRPHGPFLPPQQVSSPISSPRNRGARDEVGEEPMREVKGGTGEGKTRRRRGSGPIVVAAPQWGAGLSSEVPVRVRALSRSCHPSPEGEPDRLGARPRTSFG